MSLFPTEDYVPEEIATKRGAMTGLTGARMAGGGAARQEGERSPFDFYPTPPEPTHALLDFLEAENLLPVPSMIWEPACGDGAMAEVFRARGHSCHATDIRATGYGAQADFLTVPTLPDGVQAIITNPPFNGAVEFIRHALGLRPRMLALLLKATYWHSQGRAAWFHHRHPDTGALIRPDWVLPIGWRVAFEPERGGSPTMDVSWYVWTLAQRRPDCGHQTLIRPDGQEVLL